jgi:ribonuclease R
VAAAERRKTPVAFDDLARAARLSRPERQNARAVVAALEQRGGLVRTRGDRWTVPGRLDLVAGRLLVNRAGFGFVTPDAPAADDVYVPARHLRPAMHGDRVLVKVERRHRRGRLEGVPTRHGRVGSKGRAQGAVERVLERGTSRVVGVLRHGRTVFVLLPQDERLATVPIVVRPDATGGARDGELVVGEIVRFPTRRDDAEARVVAVLGDPADPRVETEAVIHAHGLPTEFPPGVEAAARNVPQEVSPAALGGRLDLRPLPIVTIDGENARDFDDAVLVERAGDGYRLTVAVADVAAYVKAGSPLDLEARARGTSVYFPDRVIPMLPEPLSNGICSLRPGEDRLVKVVRLDVGPKGTVRAAHFDDGVIRSAARLTYTQVRQALVDRDPDVRAELGSLVGPLEVAAELAEKLTARRRARGAIDFDLPEAEIVLDLRGRPENIVRAERSIAHRLIEEFMLAANEAVARELGRRKVPSLHRVHEAPAPEAVQDLARWLEGFGLRLDRRGDRAQPAAFAAVIEKVAGRPEERLVNTVLLRSMQQARYSAVPGGHFGLATEHYTHFTSPIRRYPDLVVHRLLDVALRGAGTAPADLAAIGEETSRRERVALEAEREIVQLKKIQFMQDKVGTSWDGFVSGVAPFGLFVELRDVFVEGLVHVTTLGGDFYELIEAQHLLRGRRTRRTFRVGDAVRVRVAGVSLERRQIDFLLHGSDAAEGGRRHEEWRKRRR